MTGGRNRKSAEQGFTLVEMLVALVIFSLLAVAGVSVLRSSLDTQEAVDSRLAELGTIGRTHALLARDLGQAVDRSTRMSGGSRPAFTGDPSSMQLVTAGWTNLDGSARSDLQRVEWRIAGNELRRTGFQNLDGSDEGASPAPLVREVTALNLRYRMRDGSWSSSFRSTQTQALPSAVEVVFTRSDAPPVTMVLALPASGELPKVEAAA